MRQWHQQACPSEHRPHIQSSFPGNKVAHLRVCSPGRQGLRYSKATAANGGAIDLTAHQGAARRWHTSQPPALWPLYVRTQLSYSASFLTRTLCTSFVCYQRVPRYAAQALGQKGEKGPLKNQTDQETLLQNTAWVASGGAGRRPPTKLAVLEQSASQPQARAGLWWFI